MDAAFRTFVTVASIVGDTGNEIAQAGSTVASGLVNITASDCLELVPQDARLSFLELAQKYDTPGEEYKVITEDGYILTVFRIKGTTPKPNALPILLIHGVLDSSDTWIIRGNTSLSINLAKDGQDVWVGNIRGTQYSLGHISPEVESDPKKYWNFTFNEHARYDLSATIDLVLNKTGAKKLNAIGHSQGTTVFFVLCSTRPEYNQKINLFTALAPIAYLQNNPVPVSTLIQDSPVIYLLARALNINEVLGESSLITQGLRLLCPLPIVGYAACAMTLFFPFAGYDTEGLDPCFLRVLIGHYPTATSLKNLYHFAQIGMRKEFAQYDYGDEGNKIAYNASTPPEYDLSKVKIKVALFVAGNDNLSTLEDVEILRKQLPNVISYKVVQNPKWNHFDYVIGKEMPKYLYPDLFDVLRVYGNI